MNILHVSNSSEIGGAERSQLLIARGLAVQGIQSLIAIPGQGRMTRVCESEQMKYEVFNFEQPSFSRPSRSLVHLYNTTKLLRRSQANLIHVNDIFSVRSVSLAAKIANIPVVCHIRFPPSLESIDWAFKRFPKPAAFIFNSQAIKNDIGNTFSQLCPRAQQFIVYNAVDTHEFKPLRTINKRHRIGVLANFTRVKGHIDFLNAARIILNHGENCEFWLIGEDIDNTGCESEMRQLCEDLKIQEEVHFLGFRSDVPELLNQLDVLVCPSHMETFGRCLIEAMACEKPVVATRVGGIPEVVNEGVTGFLVPPRSPESLAKEIIKLLHNPELAESMGKAGRERVEKLFTPKAHTDAILSVYASVLGNQ
ncbi:glycosyltransferase family 4 protein [Thalassoglobus sp.]|uniref:glycosyltransferase family 4 protein n=1 Tax=Thalassoglobus sp. TaxID=2795869 RepID=UPI003AA8A57B